MPLSCHVIWAAERNDSVERQNIVDKGSYKVWV